MDVPLEFFFYGGTDLCTPDDAAFQAWLQQIPFHFGNDQVCTLSVADVIPDVVLIGGGESYLHNLNSVFVDGEGDALTFSAMSSDEALVSVSVLDSVLTVSALDVGSATVTVTADDGSGGVASTAFEVSVPTGVSSEQPGAETPLAYRLHQNYPNPFNPVTTIAFELPNPTLLSLTVYDALGRAVATLASGDFPAGRFEKTWDAHGHPSGVYFCRLQSSEFSATQTIVLGK